MKPTCLIVTTTNWVPTARLAVAMAKAGFCIEMLCPPKHPVTNTLAAGRIHKYEGLAPVRSLIRAMESSNLDLIVPGDDLAVRHLHELYERRQSYPKYVAMIAEVIERSLGTPASFAIVQSRAAFMEVAAEEGIRVPKTLAIQTSKVNSDLDDRIGFPMVLKSDGSSGGQGVRVVQSKEEAEHAVRSLQSPPLLVRAIKRALFDNDRTLIWPSLSRRNPSVIAQSFIDGHEATSTVACWQGKALASLHFKVVRKARSAGHATVVRLIENSDISATVERIVSRLGLSGICGFDFMLEKNTGEAYLIEINPRATQVGHLTLGANRDLPAAMCSAVSGQPIRLSSSLTRNDTIALFPHEWARDPQSEYLKTAYHDVPSGEPKLIQACMRRGRKQSSWYSRDAKHSAATISHSSALASSNSRLSDKQGSRLESNPLRVMKFGGTSVGDASCIARVIEIVRTASQRSRVVVVVSAMSGVTNRLIEAANESKNGNESAVREIFAKARRQHNEVITALVRTFETKCQLQSRLDNLFVEGEKLCREVMLHGELTPKALDAIAGLGERLCAPLVAAALAEIGIASQAIEATDLIVTDSYHGEAEPQFALTRSRTQAILTPIIEGGVVPVVTGFIGQDEQGTPTTLGRGGSDYSATILASAMHAHEVEIWTDVDGFLTADPKLVPDARTIRELSYQEAGELAHFGAKVLHRKTLRPVVEHAIPLWIKNTFAPEEAGTRITPKGSSSVRPVTAVATLQEASLITLASVVVSATPNVVEKINIALTASRLEPLVVIQSLGNRDVSLFVPASLAEKAVGTMRRQFADHLTGPDAEKTICDLPVAMITLVGRELESARGIVARITAVLADAHVSVIASAHETSLSFIVQRKHMTAALSAIHREFGLGVPPSNPASADSLANSSTVWNFASEQAAAD